jgi:hypothetical protein
MPNTKIATCSYCGTRAALVLKGEETHELSCSSCGAPLHDLKKLKSSGVDAQAHRLPRPGKKGARKSVDSPLDLLEMALRKPKKYKKKYKKKSGWSRGLDLIEDLFD